MSTSTVGRAVMEGHHYMHPQLRTQSGAARSNQDTQTSRGRTQNGDVQ